MPEHRKFLIVLSDGEPFDEATEQANGHGYLDDHLRTVITRITDSNISLSAIGLGPQVKRFYSQSLTASAVSELPDLIFSRVAELLLPDMHKSNSS